MTLPHKKNGANKTLKLIKFLVVLLSVGQGRCLGLVYVYLTSAFLDRIAGGVWGLMINLEEQ